MRVPVTDAITVKRRSETPTTQLHAFKSILKIATRYPGLRRLYVTRYYNDVKVLVDSSPADIAQISEEWQFWQSILIACLKDTIISSSLERTPPQELGLLATDEWLTEVVIDRLWFHVDDQ